MNNRFSQKTFDFYKAYSSFIDSIHQISNKLNEEPSESQTNPKEAAKTGLMYATWYAVDATNKEYEICFSFIIPQNNEEPYWVLSVQSDDATAGIDEEISLNSNPLPVLDKLINQYYDEWVDNISSKDIIKEIERKIERLDSKTSPDAKLDIFDLIKKIPNSVEKQKLLELFKKKTLTALNIPLGMIKVAKVVKRKDGYYVVSKKGKNLGGPYSTEEAAIKRLRQVEYFKHRNASKVFAQLIKDEQHADHFATLIVAGLQFLFKNPDLADSMGVETLDQIADYAVSHAITESDEDMFSLALTNEEDKLIQSIQDILTKHGGKIINILPDVKNAVKNILLKNTDYNTNDYNEKGEIDSSTKALTKLVENIKPTTNKDSLLDLHQAIKSLPESSEKRMLMELFLNKTKVLANNKNRFTKFAQTATYYEGLLSRITKLKFEENPNSQYKEILEEIEKVNDPDLRHFYKIQLNKALR